MLRGTCATSFALVNVFTVTEAKPQFGRLLDRALAGELIFLRRGQQAVQIVPVAPDRTSARRVRRRAKAA